MSRLFIVIGSIICFCTFPAIEGFCEDPFEPDTVRFGEWIVDVTGPPPFHGIAVLPVIVFNDEELGRMDMIFTWTGPIRGDSGKFVDEPSEYLISWGIFFDNDVNLFYVYALAGEECIPPGDSDFVHLYFSVLDTGRVTIDSTFLPWVDFEFHECSMVNRFIPQVVSCESHIQPPPPLHGDVNQDWVVNVGDIVALVNYLYRGGAPPESSNQADVNGDCEINVGDVVYLINYLYKNGPAPVQGCAE